jgi:UDP-2-acetamido-2,6-beta-L-arabino-hexul-4-ose reductase
LRGSSLAAQRFGQIYVFTSKPGQVKGNHVHSRKWEYFLAVRGKGLLTALEMRTGARESVTLDAGDPCVAILRPGVAHAVKNDGAEELVVVAYVSEEFDPVDSDTIAVDVLGGVS